jgi:hypothetical protein
LENTKKQQNKINGERDMKEYEYKVLVERYGAPYPDKSEYTARHVSPKDESKNVYKTTVYS